MACVGLEWSRVTLALVDERWLPPGDPDSNATLVRDTLSTASESKTAAAAALRKVAGQLDGIGRDGLRQWPRHARYGPRAGLESLPGAKLGLSLPRTLKGAWPFRLKQGRRSEKEVCES